MLTKEMTVDVNGTLCWKPDALQQATPAIERYIRENLTFDIEYKNNPRLRVSRPGVHFIDIEIELMGDKPKRAIWDRGKTQGYAFIQIELSFGYGNNRMMRRVTPVKMDEFPVKLVEIVRNFATGTDNAIRNEKERREYQSARRKFVEEVAPDFSVAESHGKVIRNFDGGKVTLAASERNSDIHIRDIPNDRVKALLDAIRSVLEDNQ